MRKGTDSEKRGKCKHRHCSPMSNSAWGNLNSNGDILKLHAMWSKPDCNCQKQVSFTPKQFHLERSGFKSKLPRTFE